ncbi:hypothetical protein ABZ119_10480 [Streptomyces sp. NPDC006288]|uniref:hypothetical protein n=1 Tax=Streptomyces sp. NPDC006288 TaxID=3156743 RepID=UPI0033AA49B6
MSNDQPIPLEGIPVFTGNLATLDVKVTELTSAGTTIATTTGDVHSSFGGLQAFYQAPEAEQLFATTKPVADSGKTLQSDLKTIAGALSTYSDEVYPLVEKLKEIKRDAGAFLVKVNADDKWREDGDLIEENNHRRDEIAETLAAFQDAEIACYNKIVALVCLLPLKKSDGSDGTHQYGYDAETLKQAEGLPWGDPLVESTPGWQVWEHAWDFTKGFFVDGVGGTIKGLGTLVGFDGWDAAGQAWKGLAQLATGAVISINPATAVQFWTAKDEDLPSWLRDSRTAMKETGKALIAYDQWGENPSRAAGAVTFNVVTTVFTGGTGGAVAGGGKAALAAKALSTAGKVSRFVDPMTYVFKGAGFGLTKIGDAMTGLKGLGTIEIPPLPDNVFTLPEGAVRLADGTVDIPAGAAIPEGAVRLADGTVRLPEGVIALPEGTVKLPEELATLPEGTVKLPDELATLPEGTARAPSAPRAAYWDTEGNLYDESGNLVQRGDEAHKEAGKTDAEAPDHTRVETPVRQPVLAGAGARVGGDADGGVAHNLPSFNHRTDGGLGDNIPPARASNAMPGSATRPAGGSAENMPHNSHISGDGRNAPRIAGPSAVDNITTGGRPNGAPTTGIHENGGTPAGPHHAGGHGGAPAHGSSHGPAGGNGLPEPRDPHTYTAAERQAIMDHQVARANNDPAYRKEYYRKNGYRLDDARADETGLVPPQIVELPSGGWAPKSELAPPLKPDYLDEIPLERERKSATPEARAALDDLAKARHDAIAADRPFHVDHGNARKQFKLHRTDELRAALDEAATKHKGPHETSTKASETYGEEVARKHAIPELYPNAEPLTLHGPKNGNDQFDQVYRDGNRYVVVEAKSHVDTRLGERLVRGARFSQGSRTYFLDILEQMKKRRRNFPSEGTLATELRQALRDGRVDYIVVRGQDNAGTYTGYSMKQFDIRERS